MSPFSALLKIHESFHLEISQNPAQVWCIYKVNFISLFLMVLELKGFWGCQFPQLQLPAQFLLSGSTP